MIQAFDPDQYTAEAKKSWDKASSRYKDLSARLFGPVTGPFLSFAALQKGWRILELACGPGTATVAAAAAVGPRGFVTATDLSPRMLALGRALHIPNAQFRQADAQALDFPDAAFDAVLCQLGLMLFARPEKALTETRRVLKPKGLAAFLVQGTAESMVFTSLLMKTMIKHAPQLKVPGAPTLYAFGGPDALAKTLRDAGFVCVEDKRLCGTFPFESPEHYWQTMAEGAGRTGAMLRTLPAKTLAAIKAEVLAAAAAYAAPDGIALPYEFVMARGLKG